MKCVFKNVYELDKRCYNEYFLNEDILMEHAANKIALEIYKKVKKESLITILVGPGNNGGDGLALARILTGDYNVEVLIIKEIKSNITNLQLKRFLAVGGKIVDDININSNVIVDSIFGSGLKRDLDEKVIKIINKANKLKALKIACDIPTGIDENGNLRPIAFKADITITMGALKLALYSDFAKDFVGKIKVANLGISNFKYIKKSNICLLEKKDLTLPIRKKQNTHKKNYGHLGVLVGDKEGAGIIASLAALNFGAGLVSIVSREKNFIPYEIMHSYNISGFNALAFGMGLNNHFDDELENIAKLDIPMIIDADMFYKKEILMFLNKKHIVLTPHPKEFASLLEIINIGKFSISQIQHNRFDLVLEFSKKYPHIVLLLKGANKIIAYNKKIFIDSLGDMSLAKGGSGDVLSGMIGALLAQNLHPLKATINASLAHSIAGKYKPNYSLTPTKLINNLEKIGKKYK